MATCRSCPNLRRQYLVHIGNVLRYMKDDKRMKNSVEGVRESTRRSGTVILNQFEDVDAVEIRIMRLLESTGIQQSYQNFDT